MSQPKYDWGVGIVHLVSSFIRPRHILLHVGREVIVQSEPITAWDRADSVMWGTLRFSSIYFGSVFAYTYHLKTFLSGSNEGPLGLKGT